MKSIIAGFFGILLGLIISYALFGDASVLLIAFPIFAFHYAPIESLFSIVLPLTLGFGFAFWVDKYDY